MWQTGLQTVAYLHSQQLQSNISIQLELCVWLTDKCQSKIRSLALVWSLPLPEGHYWLFTVAVYTLH